MGGFFTNLHIRSESADSVAGAISGIVTQPAYISEAANGWVSMYPQETEDQNTDRLEEIASKFSRRLETPVLATMVHDSDIFCYWLFDSGMRVDQHDSNPDYFKPASESYKRMHLGKADVLAGYGWTTVTATEIDRVLHPGDKPTFAEETVGPFAALLGISRRRAAVGFKYLEHDARMASACNGQLYGADGFLQGWIPIEEVDQSTAATPCVSNAFRIGRRLC